MQKINYRFIACRLTVKNRASYI